MRTQPTDTPHHIHNHHAQSLSVKEGPTVYGLCYATNCYRRDYLQVCRVAWAGEGTVFSRIPASPASPSLSPGGRQERTRRLRGLLVPMRGRAQAQDPGFCGLDKLPPRRRRLVRF